MVIGGIALDKKASDVMVLQIGHLTSIADYFVICSGNSGRQVKAIAEAIRQEMAHRFGDHGAIEGETAANWVLLDYQDVIVHIFREESRTYYGIENMWRDAPQIPSTEYDSQALRTLLSQVPESPKMLHQAS